jgi:hypothetical protein
MRVSLAIVLLAGCGGSPHPADVVGPFTALPQRFVVDSLTLPANRHDWTDDLDGDGHGDNQLGNILVVLIEAANTPTANDYLASGVIAPVLELIDDGATGAARWNGSDGESGDLLGGEFRGDSFTSNRDRYTTHPGGATLHLPIFLDNAPIVVNAVGVELELFADGRGGWDGVLHGALRDSDLEVEALTASGVTQMLNADPASHQAFWDLLVPTGRGPLTSEDVTQNPIIQGVIHPDVQLFNANGDFAPTPGGIYHDSLSLGFAFHATPCASGRCGAAPAVIDACHDGVRDGAESDVDCGGGTCHACAGGLACAGGGDCQSGGCAAGACATPSCSDGLKNQFESDVDCGGPCPPCAALKACDRDDDCLTGKCGGGGVPAYHCQ